MKWLTYQVALQMGYGKHKDIYALATYSDIEITNARNTIFAGADMKQMLIPFMTEIGLVKNMSIRT